MYLAGVNVENYKSFLKSGTIALKKGFNVIVGQNNVGKTALLQSLKNSTASVPHRSTRTAPDEETVLQKPSIFSGTIVISREEVLDYVRRSPSNSYLIPYTQLSNTDNYLLSISQFRNFLRTEGGFNLHFMYHGESLTTFGMFNTSVRNEGQQFSSALVALNSEEEIQRQGDNRVQVGFGSLLQVGLISTFHSRTYFFQAERPNIGPASMEPSSELAPNASNLAQVLHYLRNTNEEGFARYRRAVRSVFPQIQQITTVPLTNNQAQIYIWHLPAETERSDLAVTLPNSGTGVGQVLAMLYVVLTSRHPRTIIIDEPQSFLHPGAVRKLFEVLAQYPQHQYIITTHSPTAVTAANPQTLLLISKEGEESTIEQIDATEYRDIRRYLAEVGARLSDVFGYDNILWVEGPTEERAFPEIAKRLLKRHISGMAILAVQTVGDLERRDAERIWDIYRRLCMKNALMPPAVAFIFDREDRNAAEQTRFTRLSDGLIAFTARRMYENYLLNSCAIAVVMNRQDNFRAPAVEANEIEDWIEERRWEKPYFSSPIPEIDRTPEHWLSNVHGAKLLDDMFKHFSDNRYTYSKVSFGYELTLWLIENAPGDLNEIAALIEEKLQNAATEN